MGKTIEAILGSAFAGLYVILGLGLFVGWAYWMWMAIQLGSFLMFVFGLLGPVGLLASFFGLWSIIFGVPIWLLRFAT
jgi:hypothetical protein